MLTELQKIALVYESSTTLGSKFDIAGLKKAIPAIKIANRTYQGSHHLDAVAAYVGSRVLTSWQKEDPNRNELVQDWIEEHWPAKVESGEGIEGFVFPGGEFLSRVELFHKIPASTKRKLGITGPEWVSSETLGIFYESYVTNNDISPASPPNLEGSVGIRKAVADVVGLMNDEDKLALAKAMNVGNVSNIIKKFHEMGEDACVYWLENAHAFYEEDRNSNWGTHAYHHHR